jgi:hypothetical protein
MTLPICENCANYNDRVCSAGHAEIMRRRASASQWSCPHFITLETAMELDTPEVIVIPKEYEGMTLERFKVKCVKKWLYIDPNDDEVIDVLVATALDQELPGDPIWLFLIGPPGATKTELARAFYGQRFYTTSSITSHTLITGLRDKNARDLLPELNGKVLIIKDFTTTLTDENELAEILSQLREAYDGYLEMNFGSGVGKKAYKSKFGLIACVTPIIDAYVTVQNLLGERFIKIRMRTDRKKSAHKAMVNAGKEDQMREELRFATLALLNEAKKRIAYIKELKIPEEIEAKMLELAIFTATARSGVHRDRQHYMTILPEAEIGTRLAKQLKKLAHALAIIRGKESVGTAEFQTILRVALDSIPKKRMKILSAFFTPKQTDPKAATEQSTFTEDKPTSQVFTSREISQEVKAPTATTTEALEDLWALGLVIRHGDETHFTWELEPTTIEAMDRSGIYLALRNPFRIDTETHNNKDKDTLTPPRLRSGTPDASPAQPESQADLIARVAEVLKEPVPVGDVMGHFSVQDRERVTNAIKHLKERGRLVQVFNQEDRACWQVVGEGGSTPTNTATNE